MTADEAIAIDERERCIAICEAWIGSFQEAHVRYLTPSQWAIEAIQDIVELIRNGHDPRIGV